MPYHVLGDRSGAVAVTVACTRSASARSPGAISAILSRTACRPSAFLSPFLPSARSSSARSFMAARSSALNPSDFFVAGMTIPFRSSGGRPDVDPLSHPVGRTAPPTCDSGQSGTTSPWPVRTRHLAHVGHFVPKPDGTDRSPPSVGPTTEESPRVPHGAVLGGPHFRPARPAGQDP